MARAAPNTREHGGRSSSSIRRPIRLYRMR